MSNIAEALAEIVKKRYTQVKEENAQMEWQQKMEEEKQLPAGVKFDGVGKDRWDLVDAPVMKAIESVLGRFAHGANKYSAGNYRRVENYNDRYYAALMRHLAAWRKGEIIDIDTGDDKLSHLSAVAWNALVLLEREIEEQENNDG